MALLFLTKLKNAVENKEVIFTTRNVLISIFQYLLSSHFINEQYAIPKSSSESKGIH